MENQVKKPVIPLVKKSDTYKIVIPEEVENKIRYMCYKSWNTEWSGSLFYTYEGSFENKDLVITCKDIFIMDIGSAAYTEFDMSPEVIAYMTENRELLDCQIGLIHSHDTMPTFFSGTDTGTLQEEGTDRNIFVSLIVNNAGKYTAAITRRVTRTQEIKECNSYPFFGEGEIKSCEDYEDSEEVIEYFYLDIEKKESINEYLDSRIAEIKESKKVKSIIKTTTNIYHPQPFGMPKENKLPRYSDSFFNNDFDNDFYHSGAPYYYNDNKDIKKESKKIPLPPEEDIKLHFNKEIIKSLVCQLISGCVIISSKNFDTKKWIANMPKLYTKRFGEGDEGMANFRLWADTYCEFLTWSAYDEKLAESNIDSDLMCSICSNDLIDALNNLPEKNEYIKIFIEMLEKFIFIE